MAHSLESAPRRVVGTERLPTGGNQQVNLRLILSLNRPVQILFSQLQPSLDTVHKSRLYNTMGSGYTFKYFIIFPTLTSNNRSIRLVGGRNFKSLLCLVMVSGWLVVSGVCLRFLFFELFLLLLLHLPILKWWVASKKTAFRRCVYLLTINNNEKYLVQPNISYVWLSEDRKPVITGFLLT